MTAYVVFIKEATLDPAEMAQYSGQVGASFAGREVRVHAAYGAQEALEGPPVEGVVILSFPDMAAARDWYSSPAYQHAAQHRFKGARYRSLLVEGKT